MNKPAFVTCIIFIVATLSCKKTCPPNSAGIDVIIKMQEALDSTGNGRQFSLLFTTVKQYGCANYTIDYALTNTGHKDIDILSITKPEICLTALGPATASVNLGVVANGTYPITLKNGPATHGILIVSDESYILKLQNPQYISVSFDTLLRVPQNTIWGHIGYSIPSQRAGVQSFIDSLTIVGAQYYTFRNGIYSYFTLIGNDSLAEGSGGYWYEKNFVYKYVGSNTALQKLVKDYSAIYHDSLFISVYNDKGARFLSWMH